MRCGRSERAMDDPRAQRTLVKSPPELWAEVSDVAALAGHLGAFGEIRITRLEAETTVAWEGDRARGTVELEPSGWGTKVTLTARLEPGAEVKKQPAPQAEVTPPEPVAEVEEQRAPEAEVTPPEPVAEVEEGPAPEQEPARRRGFFARLFGRRRDPQAARVVPVLEEPEPEPPEREAAAPAPPEPEATAPAPPEPASAPTEPEPTAPPSEAMPAPLSAGRAEEILVGVLDDLGAARHRPFSRG
jgi:hypothetical protein